MFKDLEHKINEAASATTNTSKASSSAASDHEEKQMAFTAPSGGAILTAVVLNPTTMVTLTVDYDQQQITLVPQGNVIVKQ